MKEYNKGDKLFIHGYKHNGKVYEASDGAMLLDETDDYIVLGNKTALLTKSDGRCYETKEPAILYFYKNNWFNVIAQIKKRGIYYYCNMGSPYIIEEGTVKYIDYDLDLRVFPNYKYKVLDREEYLYHSEKMNYPDEIDVILKKELNNLINIVKRREGPFDKNMIKKYYDEYKNEIKNI